MRQTLRPPLVRVPPATATAALVAILVACGPAADNRIESAPPPELPAPDTVVVPSDSPTHWTAPPELRTVLGGNDAGHESQIFTDVVNALLMEDGRLAVADRMTFQIRLFLPNGTVDTIFGRQGGGPGEFSGMGLSGMWLMAGDTIVAWDLGGNGLSFFSPEGRFQERVSLEIRKDRLFLIEGVFADGSSVGRQNWDPGQGGGHTRAWRVPESYVRLGRDGQVVTTYGDLPSWEYYDRSQRNLTPGRLSLGAQPQRAVGAEEWYYGPGNATQFLRFPKDGQADRLVVVDQPPVRLTPALLSTYVQERVASAPDDPFQRSHFLRSLELSLYPEYLPAHGWMVVADNGDLWFRRWPVPGEPLCEWLVVDSSGSHLASLDLSSSWRVTQVLGDRLVALDWDSLNVPMVVVQGIRR